MSREQRTLAIGSVRTLLPLMRNMAAALGVCLLAALAVGCGAAAVPTGGETPSPLGTSSVSAAPVPTNAGGSGTLGPYGGTAAPVGNYFIELQG